MRNLCLGKKTTFLKVYEVMSLFLIISPDFKQKCLLPHTLHNWFWRTHSFYQINIPESGSDITFPSFPQVSVLVSIELFLLPDLNQKVKL